MTHTWAAWHALEHPFGPRGVEKPEEMVAVVEEDLFADLPGEPENRERAFSSILRAPAMTFIMPTRYPERVSAWRTFAGGGVPRNVIPALLAETMDDLESEKMGALCQIRAQHRAVVACPRGPLNLGLGGTTPKTWGVGYNGIYNFVHLVVVRGPVGPEAWPMDPNWVRAILDECDGLATFTFFRWGGDEDVEGPVRETLDGRVYQALPEDR